jgi:DedD protein
LKPPDPAAATSARAESPPHPGLVLPKPAEEKAAASAGSTDDSGAAGVTTNDTDPEPQTPPEPASKSPAVPGPSPAAIASKSSGASASTAGSTSAVTVPATGGASGVAVQVGAFGNEQAAQKLVRDLQGRGYTAWIAPLQKNGKTLHRVRVGPAPDKVAAAELAQRLKQDGLPATVVGGG